MDALVLDLVALFHGKLEEQVEYKKQARSDDILQNFPQPSRLSYSSKHYHRSKVPAALLFQQP